MGHYASEMDSGWADSIKRNDRIARVKEELRNVPLSSFTAQDVGALAKLYHIVDFAGLTEEEIESLEQVATSSASGQAS